VIARAFLAALCALPGMAQAQELASADVLARPVARGTLLTSADFERQSVAAMLARGALRGVDAAGLATTRNIAAGSTLRPGDLAPPALVHRGEAVSLFVRAGALSITAPGRALSDGSAGAAIRVVNLATNRTLDGRVEASGRVLVTVP
jgi:flagellar basal body P-ring formation protein FlgA